MRRVPPYTRSAKTDAPQYLVCVSVIMATALVQLPPWTSWALLVAIALYDLFAVLSPVGPLKALVETAQERNEPIPGLVYSGSLFIALSATVGMRLDTTGGAKGDGAEDAPEGGEEEQADEEYEQHALGGGDGGIKLGLGDFIFYSVLVAHASLQSLEAAVNCAIAVVLGLATTLVLLSVYKKALPALPISIMFGIITYVMSKFVYTALVSDVFLHGAVY